jgi:Flp pilus assembly pilin Flp
MRLALNQTRRNHDGATAVEYAMVAFFISIAAFSVITSIGTHVTSIFSTIASSF